MRTLLLLCLVSTAFAEPKPFPPTSKESAYDWAQDEVEALYKNFDDFRNQIRKLDGEVQDAALSELRLYGVSVHEGALFGFSGLDFDGRSTHTQHFVRMTYDSFTLDQVQLARAILRTDEDDVALDLMKTHVSAMIRMYPLSDWTSEEDTFDERGHFLTVISRAYEHIPDTINSQMEEHLPRWNGPARIPALVVLTLNGDPKAKEELESFKGKDAEKLLTIFKVHRDGYKKRELDAAGQTATRSESK
jgi:hypothetical protein